MCRSKADGGRRCPSSRGGGGGSSAILTTISANTLTAVREPLTKVSSPSTPDPTPMADNPNLNRLMEVSAEEWLATDWKERKQVVEQAFFEARQTLGIMHAEWGGWDRSKTHLGVTKQFYASSRKVILLSDASLRFIEPLKVADTIVHELAHAASSIDAGHGKEWEDTFASMKVLVGLNTEMSRSHEHSEVERAAMSKAAAEKVHPWIGSCPQGHRFGAGRKPKYTYTCVRCDREGLDADITYNRNTNRETL